MDGLLHNNNNNDFKFYQFILIKLNIHSFIHHPNLPFDLAELYIGKEGTKV